MPKRLRTWMLWFTGAVLLLSGCATLQISSDYDQEARFDRYATFAFIGDDPRPLKRLERLGPAANTLVKKRLHRSVGNALSLKGFSQVSRGQADLLVSVHFGIKRRVELSDLPYRKPRNWGHRHIVTHYDEGTLVVDLIDRRERQLVWRGIATGVWNSGNAARREHIDNAVSQILNTFPP
jgi:hypothetical protein